MADADFPDPAVDMAAAPLRWWIGRHWQPGADPGEQTFVVADATPSRGSRDDRRARGLHLATHGMLILGVLALVPSIVQQGDQRPFLAISLPTGIALFAVGLLLNQAKLRLRRRIGYRVPPGLRTTLDATHVADSVLRDVLPHASFKLRAAHRNTWATLFYYLEELERARLHGRLRRWTKCRDHAIERCTTIIGNAMIVTGTTLEDS